MEAHETMVMFWFCFSCLMNSGEEQKLELLSVLGWSCSTCILPCCRSRIKDWLFSVSAELRSNNWGFGKIDVNQLGNKLLSLDV